MPSPVSFDSRELQRLCTERAFMTRKLGPDSAKKLGMRWKELQTSSTTVELMSGTGGWHPIDHDWPGCVGAHLAGGKTIIVEPRDHDAGPGWHVLCIGDCYKH